MFFILEEVSVIRNLAAFDKSNVRVYTTSQRQKQYDNIYAKSISLTFAQSTSRNKHYSTDL